MGNYLPLCLVGVSTFYYNICTHSFSKHNAMADDYNQLYNRKLNVLQKKIFDAEILESDEQDFEGPHLSITQDVLYWASHSQGVMKKNLTSGDISVVVASNPEDYFIPHSVVFDQKSENFYMVSEVFNNRGSIFKYDPKKDQLINLLEDNKIDLGFLSSPNDLVFVSSNHSEKIYFTDPFWFRRDIGSILQHKCFSAILGLWKRKAGLYSYDLKTNFSELVYDFGSLLAQPNGVAVDKRRNKMFVTLTGKSQLAIFDMVEDSVRYRETLDLKNYIPIMNYKNGNDELKTKVSLRRPMSLDGMTVYKDYLLIATARDWIIVKSMSSIENESHDFLLDLSSTGIKRLTNLVYDSFNDTLYVTDGPRNERKSRLWKVEISDTLFNVTENT